jgi:hypothetical protein
MGLSRGAACDAHRHKTDPEKNVEHQNAPSLCYILGELSIQHRKPIRSQGSQTKKPPKHKLTRNGAAKQIEGCKVCCGDMLDAFYPKFLMCTAAHSRVFKQDQ